MTRIDTPVVEEVSGAYTLRCRHCTFKRFSVSNPKAPAVHVCADHEIVKWEGVEVWGQKTTDKVPAPAKLKREPRKV